MYGVVHFIYSSTYFVYICMIFLSHSLNLPDATLVVDCSKRLQEQGYYHKTL